MSDIVQEQYDCFRRQGGPLKDHFDFKCECVCVCVGGGGWYRELIIYKIANGMINPYFISSGYFSSFLVKINPLPFLHHHPHFILYPLTFTFHHSEIVGQSLSLTFLVSSSVAEKVQIPEWYLCACP